MYVMFAMYIINGMCVMDVMHVMYVMYDMPASLILFVVYAFVVIM